MEEGEQTTRQSPLEEKSSACIWKEKKTKNRELAWTGKHTQQTPTQNHKTHWINPPTAQEVELASGAADPLL